MPVVADGGREHYRAPPSPPFEEWLLAAVSNLAQLFGWELSASVSPSSWQAQGVALWMQFVTGLMFLALLNEYSRVQLRQLRSDTGPPKRWLIYLHVTGAAAVGALGLLVLLGRLGWADLPGMGLPQVPWPCGVLLLAASGTIAYGSLAKWSYDPLPAIELVPGDRQGDRDASDEEESSVRAKAFARHFNRDVRNLRWAMPELLQRERDWLVPDDQMPEGDEWHERRNQYAWADSLAMHYQDRAIGTLVLLLGLVFVGAFLCSRASGRLCRC
jgi:hypothetical protein